MKKIAPVLVIAAISLTFATHVPAGSAMPDGQLPARPITLYRAGDAWKVLSKDQEAGVLKAIFISGVYEGVFLSRNRLRIDECGACFGKSEDQFYTDVSAADLVEELDRFYDDGRNMKVPIVEALKVLSMELRGEPQARIEDYLKFARALGDKAGSD